ncbi:MAG TPA: ABC transporter substrate-binding protein [Chloroflexi bacterium]|nr:ABC transporter substrate-binding protein [Chloroflexota bacterium]
MKSVNLPQKLSVLFLALLWGLMSLLLSGCQAQAPIEIGFVAGLTGRNAALGVDGRDGALLALDQINQTGGVAGRSLELVVRDDLGTPDGAIAADEDLISADVVAIIGHMISETNMAVWPIIEKSGVIFLSPTVSTPQIAGLDDNFFRLMPVNSYPAGRLADYTANQLGLKRVAIFYDLDNQAFTQTFRDGFAAQFEQLGGQVVADYPFSSSQNPDFKLYLEESQPAQPQAILIIASAADTAVLSQQVDLLNMDVQLLTSNWALTNDLIQDGGKAVDGILTIVSHDENNQSPEYLDFETRFEERFGHKPTFAAGYGYEAILILAEALQKTGGSATGLREALLETKDFTGVNGHITLDPYGDVIRTLYLITVQDGQFQTLSTLDINPE